MKKQQTTMNYKKYFIYILWIEMFKVHTWTEWQSRSSVLYEKHWSMLLRGVSGKIIHFMVSLYLADILANHNKGYLTVIVSTFCIWGLQNGWFCVIYKTMHNQSVQCLHSLAGLYRFNTITDCNKCHPNIIQLPKY